MHARIPIALLASDSPFSLRANEGRSSEGEDELRSRRKKMRRSLLLDGTGEAREEECPVDGPSGIAPPFSSLLLHMS